MKKVVTMVVVAIACACHHETEPWNESAKEKEVAMYVRTSPAHRHALRQDSNCFCLTPKIN